MRFDISSQNNFEWTINPAKWDPFEQIVPHFNRCDSSNGTRDVLIKVSSSVYVYIPWFNGDGQVICQGSVDVMERDNIHPRRATCDIPSAIITFGPWDQLWCLATCWPHYYGVVARHVSRYQCHLSSFLYRCFRLYNQTPFALHLVHSINANYLCIAVYPFVFMPVTSLYIFPGNNI